MSYYLHTVSTVYVTYCVYLLYVPIYILYAYTRLYNTYLHSVLHRISFCSLPGDPYNMVDMLSVWLNQPLSWYDDSHQQQVLQAFLCERGAFVHIALKGHSLISKQAPSLVCGLMCVLVLCACVRMQSTYMHECECEYVCDKVWCIYVCVYMCIV